MSFDFNYGKRTGVTSFKQQVAELCELFRKFQVPIQNWVHSSGAGLSTSEQALIDNLIGAVNAACAAVQAMVDD